MKQIRYIVPSTELNVISLASLLLAGSQSAPGDIGFSSDPAVPIQGGD